MNVVRIIDRSIALILAFQLLGCAHTPSNTRSPLQSRPTWEMYPRASSPPPTCPGQYRSVIASADGDLFLGCWGEKTDSGVSELAGKK
jgi:hypothetical protein